MHPIAFHVAGHPVRFAGLLYIVAAIVAWVLAYRVARRRGWDTNAVLPGLAIVVAAAYLGARIHGALNDWDLLAADPLRGLLGPGNLSFFGGLALGSVVLVAYLKWVRLPIGRVADALAPVAPIVYALFRLGCFLNGDDYGRPTSVPWGLSFPEGSPPTAVRVHPVQLYEIMLMIPVMLVLRWRGQHQLRDGALAFELCMLMGTERFIVEFWRSGVGSPGFLSEAQWLSLGLSAFGFAARYRLTTTRRSGAA